MSKENTIKILNQRKNTMEKRASSIGFVHKASDAFRKSEPAITLRALLAARDEIEDQAELESFDSLVEQTVSAPLYNAFVNLRD
jgi:hypothetical protein